MLRRFERFLFPALDDVRWRFPWRIAEENHENNQHRARTEGWRHPDVAPVVLNGTGDAGQRVQGEDFTGQHCADERADAPENERDEALAGTADPFVRFVVHIELPSNEKKV